MKKINYKVLESKDGKCPYCDSDYVLEVCDEEAERVRNLMPEGQHKIFKCYRCNKYFTMSGAKQHQ